MRCFVLLLAAVFASSAQVHNRFPGFRVYEGDMLLPDSAITSLIPARLWTNNTVPYVIDSDIPNPSRIMDAITWYNQNTPVTYQPRASEANFVHYVRSTVGNGVCYSSVGMIGGEQFIHVEDACNTGTMIHEMTHATGFYHEQERQDRNLYITVLYENIDKAQFGEFPIPGTQTEQDVGGYEYASHMHYGAFEFSCTGLPVMESVPAGIGFDPYPVLSPGDLDTLFRMYGKPPTQTTLATNPPGLQMIVDGATVTAPQVYNWAPVQRTRWPSPAKPVRPAGIRSAAGVTAAMRPTPSLRRRRPRSTRPTSFNRDSSTLALRPRERVPRPSMLSLPTATSRARPRSS
jgi:hypothetical protein